MTLLCRGEIFKISGKNTKLSNGFLHTVHTLLIDTPGGNAINPLVAFYDIHGRKRGAILLICPGHHRRPYNNFSFLSYNKFINL
jgi:hypothetical protein